MFCIGLVPDAGRINRFRNFSQNDGEAGPLIVSCVRGDRFGPVTKSTGPFVGRKPECVYKNSLAPVWTL